MGKKLYSAKKLAWKVWAWFELRHEDGLGRSRWHYIDSLWYLATDFDGSPIHPLDALALDQQHWGD